MVDTINLAIHGPVGTLEAIIQTPQESKAGAVAILCHPLPTAGGTMHNKVIYTIGQGFLTSGIRTIKWNTRGTGASEGVFDQGKGEVNDLNAVIAYACHQLHAERIWLAGFSFGSAVAFSCARDWHYTALLQQLILLAPPVTRYDYRINAKQQYPLLLIQGDLDEIVDTSEVHLWYQQQRHYFNQSTYICMENASHFFHGTLVPLRTALVKHIAK